MQKLLMRTFPVINDLKKIEISEISIINNKLELEQNSFHETDIIDIYKNE